MRKLYFIIALFGLSVNNVSAQTTYKDVAPIFYKNCTVCHNPKGVEPMSLLNYSETFAYAKFIKTYVSQGLMPPWPPDTLYHKFFDQRTLTAYEKNTII